MVNHTGGHTRRRRNELYDWDMNDDDNEEEEEFDLFAELCSDDEIETETYNKRRCPNKERNHAAGHNKLMEDYFVPHSTYDDRDFERRFRLRKELFLQVMEDLEASCPYFVQKPDCTGKMGLSCLQKVTSAIRQLAYGCASDATDEYCRIGEATSRKTLKMFCLGINNLYSKKYLRSPTPEDLTKILSVNYTRGFPGCIGSLDCMHWEWKNCPSALAGQYKGKEKKPTVVLEAVADQSLWIWHVFFGTAGALNDINILDRSPLFERMIAGTTWDVQFSIQGRTYEHGYYLVDGIYPSWATLIKGKGVVQDTQSTHFQKLQEAFRKDIERAFAVLQVRWAIITLPARIWNPVDMMLIMKTAIILHNMIVEDHQRDSAATYHLPPNMRLVEPRSEPYTFRERQIRTIELRSGQKHRCLTNDLIDFNWARLGGGCGT